MAKEANKTTVIALLVVAGILLFLVGSFTGQTIFGKVNPKTTLTIQQKQEVLNMLNNCIKVQAIFGSSNEDSGDIISNINTGDDICNKYNQRNGKNTKCIFSLIEQTVSNKGLNQQNYPLTSAEEVYNCKTYLPSSYTSGAGGAMCC